MRLSAPLQGFPGGRGGAERVLCYKTRPASPALRPRGAPKEASQCRTIESVLQETRVFPPSPEFVKQANVSGMAAYQALCDEAERDFEGFWARLAREHVLWHKPFTKVLDESNAPFFKWFHDGELNASYNCLDRHLEDPARQDRDHLRGRRRQGHQDHLQGALPPRLPVRQRR